MHCRLHRLIMVIALLSLCVTEVLADGPDTLWMRAYRYPGFQRAFSVKQTDDGGCIVAGTTQTTQERNWYDLHAIRINAAGDTVWTKSYGSNQYIWGGWVELIPDGGYLFTALGWANAFVVRTDAYGDTIWTNTYADGKGWALTLTSDGGFVIGGSAWGNLYLLKADGQGDMLWMKRYGGRCGPGSVRETSDGGFIVAGYKFYPEDYSSDLFLMKTDAEGDSLWSRVIDVDAEDGLSSVQETSDGGFIATGWVGEEGPIGDLRGSFGGIHNVYLLKTDSNGDTLWTRIYGGQIGGEGQCVRELPDGDYLVAGHTGIFIGPINLLGRASMNVYLIRTDMNGDTLWTREYGGPDRDGGYGMDLTMDGGCILAGFTESFGAVGSDFFVLKTQPFLEPNPLITSIDDVPNDEGRQVRISWYASMHDNPHDAGPVTGYSVWRRIDADELGESLWRCSPEHRLLTYPPGSWDYVVTVPARCEDTYNCVVPTLCDSTLRGMCWSVFFVSAMTGEPSEYFDSDPDSGYSVDNTPPGPPEGLRFISPTELAWDECEAGDFDHFSVYGSNGEVLDGSARLIERTACTTCDVMEEFFTYYHLTASDLAGNEGEPSTIACSAGISEYALFQNRPNPFVEATVVRFDLPESGRVNLSIFDVSGRRVRTMVRETLPAGRHSVEWVGNDDSGSRVSPGIYVVRIDCGAFTDTKKALLLR